MGQTHEAKVAFHAPPPNVSLQRPHRTFTQHSLLLYHAAACTGYPRHKRFRGISYGKENYYTRRAGCRAFEKDLRAPHALLVRGGGTAENRERRSWPSETSAAASRHRAPGACYWCTSGTLRRIKFSLTRQGQHLKGVGSESLKAMPALLTRTSHRPYSVSISVTKRCIRGMGKQEKKHMDARQYHCFSRAPKYQGAAEKDGNLSTRQSSECYPPPCHP